MDEKKVSEISIRNVGLVLEKTTILDDVCMEMKKGNIYGLIGRNGSGKTMLMKCICGFVKPTKGNIMVRNQVVGKDIDFPENMGILIENPGFISYYDGIKNLIMLAGLNRKIDRRQIEETMRFVGLDPKMKRHVQKYSLGMKQRLGIAQAIMEDPDILILDEPMNGLDKEGVKDMRTLLLELKKKEKTILIASHNAEDIDELCDHVWEMEHGRSNVVV
ncbi:MAG: ATP-binding cassette domain-containing protein [Lachnospiraceae bacterium]|nr:ATP-binding cassette domain-containing protein [Lachnospiraceae bacterium]MBD5482867.1 ATP-binding cassette domain-containing protein [Lachnospiraceae bacterium]